MEADVATESCRLTSYRQPEFVYDEFRTPQGTLRPHWQPIADMLEATPAVELTRRWQHANRIVQDNGTAYNAFGDADGAARPWEVDLLPIVFPKAEWRTLAEGIAQRARLLSLIVDDVYGPQELLHRRDLPPEVVLGHPAFARPFASLPVNRRNRLVLFGVELARSPEGCWFAMADRTEAPTGTGYALENRIAISRTLPGLMHDARVERLAPFFLRLQQRLAGLTARLTEDPRVVLLTAGPGQPSYFEDVYLARYLGYTLVEGADLAVRNDRVFIKTLGGLLPVDVILNRVRDGELDPLELGGTSSHGVAGLLQAVREGNVAIANTPGCGLVESPIFMAFLPKLCQVLLGEDLKLPSIATWWCGDESARDYVLSHLQELVIKPAFAHSGQDEVIVDQLSRSDVGRIVEQIRRHPRHYIAQERIARSAAPVWTANGLEPGHVALRAFAASSGADEFDVLSGALVRVASTPGPMELSIIAGEGSKDLWVLADEPVQPTTLLPPVDRPVPLKRNPVHLPSRAADNLYWLGRQLDRADIVARMSRAVLARLSEERDSIGIPELPALVRALADQGQIPPDYAVEEFEAGLPEIEEVLPRSLFDVSNQYSLLSTTAEMLRLASTVRDRLSPDTWRAIHHIDETFCPDAQRTVLPFDEALVLLDQLVMNLAACTGLIGGGMVRGVGWRFLDMGRRIERSLRTISLIRSLVDERGQAPAAVLDTLLEVMDSQMTYRFRYLTSLSPAPALDLLMTDESNPRSLLFQIAELVKHVDALPKDPGQVGLSTAQKVVQTARHDLMVSDLAQLVSQTGNRNTVASLLNRQEKAIHQLDESITRTYLVHSGTPRQMEDSPVIPA